MTVGFIFSLFGIIVQVVSVIVHFFVFHRLKCTKDLASCVRDHFSPPDENVDSSDIDELKFLQEIVGSVESLAKCMKNRGRGK